MDHQQSTKHQSARPSIQSARARINAGLPQSGKKSWKKIFFQDHGKVMEFCYKSVKMSFFEKVRENRFWSGNFLFFILIF